VRENLRPWVIKGKSPHKKIGERHRIMESSTKGRGRILVLTGGRTPKRAHAKILAKENVREIFSGKGIWGERGARTQDERIVSEERMWAISYAGTVG